MPDLIWSATNSSVSCVSCICICTNASHSTLSNLDNVIKIAIYTPFLLPLQTTYACSCVINTVWIYSLTFCSTLFCYILYTHNRMSILYISCISHDRCSNYSSTAIGQCVLWRNVWWIEFLSDWKAEPTFVDTWLYTNYSIWLTISHCVNT